MYVSNAKNIDTLSADKNYYHIPSKQFIFQRYKTQKKYGKQVIDIPENLNNILTEYLKRHNGKTKTEYSLLVKYDGEVITTNNAITRILNKIFHKNIGSSMLRHIFLTSKYENINEEKEKDAQAMGHSVDQQNKYVLNK
jgi:hypothetical protein